MKITRQFITVGVLLGLIYIFFKWGFADLYHYLNGAIVGMVLGLLLALSELYVFSRGAKKLRFIWLLILRTVVYLVLIVTIIINVVAISRMVTWDMDYLSVIQDKRFVQGYLIEGDFSKAVIYALIFAFSVNFVRMISRKMGQGMLLSYISGTYYRPVHQVRIIMFINLVESRSIINKLGPMRYHEFLSEFYYDLTIPVVSNQGIIYEYIEDLMVISWSMDKGLHEASCIRAFFDIQHTLAIKKEKYRHRFDIEPQVQAGLHTGSVVRAEIGAVKTQIVFHGDTMNTSARILGKCRELGRGLLASDQLVRIIGLPNHYQKVPVGEIELRGKQEPIKLFEIIENKGSNA